MENHLDKANQAERLCQKGFKRKLLSRDNFELERINNSIKLHYISKNRTYNENQFCLNFKENNVILAEVCHEIEELISSSW